MQISFGSFDEWQMDFLGCAQASRCGWVVTGFNVFTHTYMNYVIDLHSLNVPIGVIPVIVMDVWQHAYYLKLQNSAPTASVSSLSLAASSSAVKAIRFPLIK